MLILISMPLIICDVILLVSVVSEQNCMFFVIKIYYSIARIHT